MDKRTSAIKSWLTRWLWNRRHERALNRFGWDGKCARCGRWHHTDACATFLRETEWHWHYLCDCGEVSHWFLGNMFPMRAEIELAEQNFWKLNG